MNKIINKFSKTLNRHCKIGDKISHKPFYALQIFFGVLSVLLFELFIMDKLNNDITTLWDRIIILISCITFFLVSYINILKEKRACEV
jgi:hypothetical protein